MLLSPASLRNRGFYHVPTSFWISLILSLFIRISRKFQSAFITFIAPNVSFDPADVNRRNRRTRLMTTTCKTVTTTLGLAIFAATFAPLATAGCGDLPGKPSPSLRAQPPYLMRAAYRPAQLVRVSGNDPAGASIVGLWKVTFTAGGTVIDWGYAQWHSDGTEIMNSGGRAPATENFCLGVWEKAGPSTYKLNHVALSYDAASGALNATVSIREVVKVNQAGNKYEGWFTIDATDPSGNPAGHVAGEITGERITADQ
jgi:hypothetical protein